MTKLNALLLLALLVSALALVKTAYDGRRLYAQVYSAEAEGQRLAAEHTRLEAERQLQATSVRVDRTAREKLQMRPITPAVMMVEDGAPGRAPLVLPQAAAGRAGATP